MNRCFHLLLFIFCCGEVSAQQNVPLSREYLSNYTISLEKLDNNFHTSVLPYLHNELDTSAEGIMKELNLFFTKKKEEGSFSYFLAPLTDISYSRDLRNDTSYFAPGAGISAEITWRNKLAAGGQVFTQNGSYLPHIGNYMNATGVAPGLGIASPTAEGFSVTPYSYYLSFSPNHIFNLQAGTGKHFFGDGYRSLLLSDNSYNYPYFRLSTTFWRVKYINLFAMMNDISGSENDLSGAKRKYVSIHYLNWNISRRVSLGIFESVVWQAKDTLLNRQFDIHYLNPFVFYRPVEYSLGSADNSLLGMNLKVKITDRYQLYGQVLLDEFLLEQVRADSGWWANKYAFQVGAKALEPLGIKNLQLQAEFNVVRPFTYSHGEVLQNYGHQNEPLAHPLGANFREWIGFIRYAIGNIQIEEQLMWAGYGTDSSYHNFGGNLYQSYKNRFQDYHNFIGQGLYNTLFYHRLRISWVIAPEINLRFYAQHVFRELKNANGVFPSNYFQVGVSSLLWNQYSDR